MTKNRLTRAIEFKLAAWLTENREMAQTSNPFDLSLAATKFCGVTVNRNNMVTMLRDLGIERVQPRTDADRIADLETSLTELETRVADLEQTIHQIRQPQHINLQEYLGSRPEESN